MSLSDAFPLSFGNRIVLSDAEAEGYVTTLLQHFAAARAGAE